MPSAREKLSPWLFTCVVFIFSADLVVRVPFIIWFLGQCVKTVPDHYLFIYLATVMV